MKWGVGTCSFESATLFITTFVVKRVIFTKDNFLRKTIFIYSVIYYFLDFYVTYQFIYLTIRIFVCLHIVYVGRKKNSFFFFFVFARSHFFKRYRR